MSIKTDEKRQTGASEEIIVNRTLCDMRDMRQELLLGDCSDKKLDMIMLRLSKLEELVGVVLTTLQVSLSGQMSADYGVSGKIPRKVPIIPAKQSNPTRNVPLGRNLRHSGNDVYKPCRLG